MVELAVDSVVAKVTCMLPDYFVFGQRLWMPIDCLDGMHPV